MSYDVGIESLSQDVPDIVRDSILSVLENYAFPYANSVQDKDALRNVFVNHFTHRKSLDSLVDAIKNIATKPQHAAAVAWTETNRVHTAGLANTLKSHGQTKCKTVHTYGQMEMQNECIRNIEDKILDIDDVLKNTFPESVSDLRRKDVPMIPQHVNCRHVMSPLDEFEFQK